MSHFAKIDSNNIVTQIIVAEQDFINSGAVGDSFLWVQTSYNNNFRKQFAGAGHIYDSTKDIFIVPQPFASWDLDSSNDWQPPIALPSDASLDKQYEWDEDVYQADNSKGWVVVE